jgi:DNA-binding transcriptional ArsR family regulator
VDGDADLAAAAALIGGPTRAALLLALMEEEPLPARELAVCAGIAPSTASEQLAQLVDGDLLMVERRGRQRWFRLADPAVAVALEALSAIAPLRPVRSLREANAGEAIRQARTCYDHLAGVLGVALAAALEREGVLVYDGDGDGYALGPQASAWLGDLGIDVAHLSLGRRPLVRPCLDWSERRRHVAGAVGAALTARLFELGWLKRRTANRSVELTPLGRAQLRAQLGLELPL